MRIAGQPIDGSWWLLEVPMSEQRRLLDRYVHFDPSAEPYRRLDIVVLTRDHPIRQFLHPESGPLRLSWANDVFEIWIPVQ